MSSENTAFELAAHAEAQRPTERFAVPTRGAANPGTSNATPPGSLAPAPDIGGPLAFPPADTPCMPAPSPKTP